MREELRVELETGIALAADPENAYLPDLAARVTTSRSRWFARGCRECKLKFREGDQVRLCPQCATPYHDDPQYGLRCWTAHFVEDRICTQGGKSRFSGRETPRCDYVWHGRFPDTPTGRSSAEPPARPPSLGSSLVSAFIDGLEGSWRPFGDEEVAQVEPGSDLVGRNCPWCRFRLRAGDAVVACPCGCGAWFHQDVVRHMTCWNEWNGVEGNDYCPITGRSYRRTSPEGNEDRGE